MGREIIGLYLSSVSVNDNLASPFEWVLTYGIKMDPDPLYHVDV